MWKRSKNVILNNVDFSLEENKYRHLSDNNSKVVPSVTIKDANAADIYARVAGLLF